MPPMLSPTSFTLPLYDSALRHAYAMIRERHVDAMLYFRARCYAEKSDYAMPADAFIAMPPLMPLMNITPLLR